MQETLERTARPLGTGDEEVEREGGGSWPVRLVHALGSAEAILVSGTLALFGLLVPFLVDQAMPPSDPSSVAAFLELHDMAHALWFQLVLFGLALNLAIRAVRLGRAEGYPGRWAGVVALAAASAGLVALVVVREAGQAGRALVLPERPAEGFTTVMKGYPVVAGLGFRLTLLEWDPASGTGLLQVGPLAGPGVRKTYRVDPGAVLERGDTTLVTVGAVPVHGGQEAEKGSQALALALDVSRGPSYHPVWAAAGLSVAGLGGFLWPRLRRRGEKVPSSRRR